MTREKNYMTTREAQELHGRREEFLQIYYEKEIPI